MKETANITKQEEDSVIAEFEQASSSGEVQFQGREFMESILKKALGPDKAARMLGFPEHENVSRHRRAEMG